jgi:glutamate/tyrosine decarboxylase-like PLP-dependent enzyme
MANFLSVVVARKAAETSSPSTVPHKYLVYTSIAAHRCISQAVEMSGLSFLSETSALRQIPTDASHRMDTAALQDSIKEDKGKGFPA